MILIYLTIAIWIVALFKRISNQVLGAICLIGLISICFTVPPLTETWSRVVYLCLFLFLLQETFVLPTYKGVKVPRLINFKKLFISSLWRLMWSAYWLILGFVSAKLGYLLFKSIAGIWNFYMTFFLQPELWKFLWGPGLWYLGSLVCTFILTILLLFVKIRKEWILVIMMVFNLFAFSVIENKFTAEITDKVWIWDINPKVGTHWDTAKIDGVNFGDQPWAGKVDIAGINHRIISWNNRQIVFELQPGLSKSGLLKVTTYNQKISNEMYFEVYDIFTKEIIK